MDQLSIVSGKSYIGLVRSFIALGTLLTILFNPPSLLFINTQATTIDIKSNKLSIFYLIGPDHIYIATIICIIILTIVISGYWPRFTCVLHWWVSYSIFNSVRVLDGGDQITTILTLLLIPICTQSNKNHWSFDTIKTLKQKSLIYFFLTLARFQICFLYFQAAIEKLSVPEWKDGTAFYYYLHNRAFVTFTGDLLFYLVSNPLLVITITWGSIAIELLLSVAFFVNHKYWKTILYIGLTFHFLIFLVLGLASFSLAMTGALILYLLPYKAEQSEFFKNNIEYELTKPALT